MTIDEAVVDQVLAEGPDVADRLRADPAPDHVDVLTLEEQTHPIQMSYAAIAR